jgi:hypothetical protein
MAGCTVEGSCSAWVGLWLTSPAWWFALARRLGEQFVEEMLSVNILVSFGDASRYGVNSGLEGLGAAAGGLHRPNQYHQTKVDRDFG